MEPLALRRAPLLAAACCFSIGLIAARNWQPASLLALSCAFLFVLALLALRSAFRIAVIPVAGLWVVAGMWCWHIRPTPDTQKDLLQYADGLSREVRGHVVRVRVLAPAANEGADKDAPMGEDAGQASASALSVDLAVSAIEEVTPDVSRMVRIEGGVRATVLSQDGALPSLACGDKIEVPLRLRAPERYHDPGAWQNADYLLAQGIAARGTARAPKVRVLGGDSAKLRCRINAVQQWASDRMLSLARSKVNRRLPSAMRLTEDDAGMLNAMLFGDRTRLDHVLRLGFERTGTFHLFVVSGMHVALLAGLVYWLAQRLRLRRWLATLITLTLMTFYALLTGFGAPVQRALFMTAVFLVARLLSREGGVLNALGAAALAELVWAPSSLFEASFQMTFLAIVAIAGIAVPIGEQTFLPYARAARRLGDLWMDPVLPPRVAQFRVMLRMWTEAVVGIAGRWARNVPVRMVRALLVAMELALIGLVAEMVMALPMAVYFHRATLFALPSNMLTVPLISLLAPAAMITFCASLLGTWMAVVPAAVTALLLHGIVWTIGWVSQVRAADLRVPAPAWWICALAVLCWAFCCWAARRSRTWTWVAAAILPLVLAAALWPEPALVQKDALEVTALDVGQGDSLLVVSPQGETMLVDAGGPVGGVREVASATSGFDVGEEVVSPYLWSRRIRRLDVLVLSHAHSDHMGGMPAVMQNFRPRELWVATDPNSEAYRSLLQEATALGVRVRHLRAGDNVQWAGAELKVLAPERSYRNGGEPSNDDSLVMRLEYGRSSVLLEGDAEAASEQAMLARGLVPVTLLKVGHHGSRTSTTADFLNALTPKDAVISVGRNNHFGHPRPEIISRIADEGTRLFRTDEFGLTTFLLDRDGRVHAVLAAENEEF
ncbi:ComEC/Rec2 family competence protein [Edaphobacter sp. 12200R-103]|uniref:ComEC/Rec2 family competence protein n=1 Tax=Edaphobacter sp. 12200R-103 TaxID=2703788 RepID=UPI00138C327D|nr:ComEC/Rec2 family competence protein [Edaphobacter sp. 12200R-103]QHS53791.1 ComEC/Rec2 family competence protein [Edaphobacter sp. 12200R-103]